MRVRLAAFLLVAILAVSLALVFLRAELPVPDVRLVCGEDQNEAERDRQKVIENKFQREPSGALRRSFYAMTPDSGIPRCDSEEFA